MKASEHEIKFSEPLRFPSEDKKAEIIEAANSLFASGMLKEPASAEDIAKLLNLNKLIELVFLTSSLNKQVVEGNLKYNSKTMTYEKIKI